MLTKRTFSESERHRKEAEALAALNPFFMEKLGNLAGANVPDGVLLEMYALAKIQQA